MKLTFLFLMFSCGLSAYSQDIQRNVLKISPLFGDHMVLQQNSDINFSGDSSPGKKLIISASWGRSVRTTADLKGKWKVKLLTPKAGGPYNIDVKTAETVLRVNDILIGEVWLASGQSNMDIPLKGWPPGDTILNSKLEINKANYPKIRFFKVPFGISTVPSDSLKGNWVAATPNTAGDFSATAYFFAIKLNQELKVPIGVIQSSIGGTPAEAWTSKEGLKKIGDFDEIIGRLDSLDKTTKGWFRSWTTLQIPKSDMEWKDIKFSDFKAAESDYDDSDWAKTQLPGKIDRFNSVDLDGAIWLRKNFNIIDDGVDYSVKLGSVDDMESIYVNGKYIGGLTGPGHAADLRIIKIPKSLLLKGNNIIAIRVIDTGGAGSVQGEMAIVNDKGVSISIAGEWRSRVVAEIFNGKFYIYGLQKTKLQRPDISKINSNSPTVLFNAMINPLLSFTFKGIIWYQGESNVGRADQYKRLFPAMIQDWRNKFGQNLPFYYVQIAPYLYTANDQKEQSAKLRDAQRYALGLSKTGMVSTLDIGYLKTAHPPNKIEVGFRLARFAMSNDYGKKMVSSGPLFKKATISGSELILEFESIGSGLATHNMPLNNFEVAGKDKVYRSAEARILGNTVIVGNFLISHPVYVRYAWSDGSSATLFNKEGLPASTFTSER